MKRRVASGHALVEFTVCCAVLVIALLVPWEGNAPVIDQLARTMGTYLRVLTFLLSIS
jgi:hypothetical protein